ncbi:hypothetical protein COY27_05545 [Candidatus Woesearchaeota archaeon CG_4_10_14_0_2_um_filter_33_13]|nr:MAG: hypothetical protein COY27_05545 [Candidatus Woesearchaeota archaeon CG_4_10_14_0_2_um_filter_33_13]
MGTMIAYDYRNVKAKGLNKEQVIDEEKLKSYFFDEDFENLALLDKINLNYTFLDVSLLYPGCGADIFFPLIYLEKLFPTITKAKLIFVDSEDNLGLIKTVLDEVGVSFSEKDDYLSFYWKEKLITLHFFTSPIEDYLPNLENFSIYFEKAFRIMRDRIPNYEKKIYSKLNKGGVIISDTGFEEMNLSTVAVPLELSSYGEMIIGIKEEK